MVILQNDLDQPAYDGILDPALEKLQQNAMVYFWEVMRDVGFQHIARSRPIF